MLVLTQWGGGILAAVALKAGLAEGTPTARDAGMAALGCFGVQGGLIASVFHLGRPLQAWRIGLGWRTSWLSREAIALGIFSAVSLLFTGLIAAVAWFPAWLIPSRVLPGTAVVLLSLLFVATLAQVQVYAVTGRVQWRLGRTIPRFAGTVLMGVGVGCGLLVSPTLTPALGLLLMGLSVAERWQFFTGRSVADAVSRDGGVR
jgi:DMSO reductase anchor subunit